MEFKAEYRSYLGRYFGTLWITIVMMMAFFFGFQVRGKDFYFAISSIERFYFSDIKLTLFFLAIPFFYHVASYLTTNKYPKLLTLSEDSITFNFFKKPSLTINYLEIKSLEYSDKIRRDFVFILKNGEKKVIPSAVRGYVKAFEEINKKINEVRK